MKSQKNIKEKMMKKKIFITVCLLSLIFTLSSVHAQGVLKEFMTYFGPTNGPLKLQPLADAFGANMNSGIFHGAKIHRSGFHQWCAG